MVDVSCMRPSFRQGEKRKQSWEDLNDICALVDKEFLNQGANGRQELALQYYLASLSTPQVVFAVSQIKPNSVEGAVAATLEVESSLIPVAGLDRVAQVLRARGHPGIPGCSREDTCPLEMPIHRRWYVVSLLAL